MPLPTYPDGHDPHLLEINKNRKATYDVRHAYSSNVLHHKKRYEKLDEELRSVRENFYIVSFIKFLHHKFVDCIISRDIYLKYGEL